MMDNAFARRGALALWDIVSWALATAVVIGVRHDFHLTEVLWDSVIAYWLLASVLLLGLGYATKFYRGRYLVGSFDEALGLALHFARRRRPHARDLPPLMSTPAAAQRRRCWPRPMALLISRRRPALLPRAARPPAHRRSRARRAAAC